MEFLDRNYNASDVGRTNKMSIQRLNSWHERGLITGLKDLEGAGKQGRNRRYSFYNVMEVALAEKIIGAGIAANLAYKASRNFAHAGDGGAIFDQLERFPGFPFHHDKGETAFAFCGDHSFETIIGRDNAFQALDDHLHGIRNLASAPMIVVNVSALFTEICGAMGIHDYAALDAVYGVAA